MEGTVTQKKVFHNQMESMKIMEAIKKKMYKVDQEMHWGHVGTSAEVKQRLQEILDFVSGESK